MTEVCSFYFPCNNFEYSLGHLSHLIVKYCVVQTEVLKAPQLCLELYPHFCILSRETTQQKIQFLSLFKKEKKLMRMDLM